jgi:hypothetical protein
MLHTELLRLINSRETWALIGSGPSIEAGYPAWDRLLDEAESALDPKQLAELRSNTLFTSAKGRGDLPAAFMAIESLIGRDALEASVKKSLKGVDGDPGNIHRFLAELPFAGYITTNYDDLLERSLNRIDPGWTAVGNVDDEVRKASGTAERVVWHIHGAAGLDSLRSRLIITDEDYDQIYLDESRVFRQLKGLLANRRIIVIGFGFRDHRMMQLLRSVGRLTDATRPIYALVERGGDFRYQIGRQVFLRENKIDVHPYRNDDGKHQNLRHTLSVYSAMSLRRSLRFGRHLDTPPSYDPETTGLLIYNDLVLNAPREVPQQLRASILRARVLSICEVDPRTREQLTDDLNGILDALTQRIGQSTSERESEEALNDALERLVADELLIRIDDTYSLSPPGRETVLDHAAAATRLEEQFTTSIRTRIGQAAASLRVRSNRPTQVVCAFFREAIERRALGVALAFATGWMPTQRDYHALALLQSIGDWLDTANDEAEALCVIQTIQDIFRRPTAAESSYLGTAVQARFVLHLLSLDNDTLAIRLRELKSSLFIIDASTLIPWLASRSAGNDSAQKLIRGLQEAGAMIATTQPLVEELAEHARWAQKKIASSGGINTLPVFEAVTGRAGNKTNAFLEGWRSAHEEGAAPASFDEYLAQCLSLPSASNPVMDSEVSNILARHQIKVLDYDSLAADDTTLIPDRDEYIRLVQERRMAAASYTHDRQVRAEAEAVVLVKRARSGTFGIDGATASNAYFVSNTSMLSQVAKSSVPITMRPEAARAWLATIHPAAAEDVQAIMSELLWELQERQMDLIDSQSLLNTFGPLIAAAKERLEEVLPKYQVLIAKRYGGTWKTPEIADLDAPVVLDSILFERVNDLERTLAQREAELEAAKQEAAMSEKDRADLERAREKERLRQKYLRRAGRKKRRH